MKRVLRFSALIAALLLTPALVRAANPGLSLQPGSKLWLSGSSNVHDFTSTASKLNVVFSHGSVAPGAALPRGEAIEKLIREGGVKVEVTLPVTGLHSGKDGLDKNMYKALLASEHPEIRFTLADYKVHDGTTAGELAIEARGQLRVAGVELEQAIFATVVREGDTVRLRGRVPLKMTQFSIKPPKMMLGTMRTSNDIVVHFDLLIGATVVPLVGAETNGRSQ